MKTPRPPGKRKRPRPSAQIVRLPVQAAPTLEPPAPGPPPDAPQAAKRKTGPAAWVPSRAERKLVEICAAIGMTLPQTAMVLGKSAKSIQRRCPLEWKTGLARINAKIAGKLISKAMAGDTASLIFLAKTRLGWNEKQLHELTGRDGGPIVYDKIRADADAFTARIAALGGRQAPPVEPAQVQETVH